MPPLGPLHIIKQSNSINSASVIFLHGSGDTGQGFLNWIKFLVGDLVFPHIKCYFPTAPLVPYTPLQGEESNVWFDRYDITPEVPEHKESLEAISVEINKLIKEIEDSGVPKNRIVVGGFSMGGALALHTAFRFTSGLGGVFTMSSFLNNNSLVYSEIKQTNIPFFMWHGDRDTLVPISWGRETQKQLEKVGVKPQFVSLKNTMHELKKSEIETLSEWLLKILPPLDSDK